MERMLEIDGSLKTALTKAENIKNKSDLTQAEEVIADLNAKHFDARNYLAIEFKAKLEGVREKVQATRNIVRPCTQAELAHRYSAPMRFVICIPAHIDSRCSRFEAAAHVAADS